MEKKSALSEFKSIVKKRLSKPTVGFFDRKRHPHTEDVYQAISQANSWRELSISLPKFEKVLNDQNKFNQQSDLSKTGHIIRS